MKEQHEKRVVFPGEVLATGMDSLPGFGTYRNKNQIICSRLGMLSREGKVIKVIPLSGKYLPKKNDIVIGKVFDILMSGWRIDINSPYSSMLSMKEATYDFINKGEDLTKFFDLGDYVVAKIVNVTSQNLVDVSTKGPGLKKLVGGRIVKINTHKVPRLIGRKGSMVSMIKSATDCKVIVGQNGLVWVYGSPDMEIIAINAIRKIEDESFHSGLTEKMKTYLEGITHRKLEIKEDQEYQDQAEHPHHDEQAQVQ